MKKKNSTDIAKIAGVSRSTVSKVINNYPSISEDTRKIVWDAIEKSEYTPDMSGRILAGKGSETLAFFLFTRDTFHTDMLVNAMISTMIDVAANYNFHILTYIVRYPIDEEARRSAREVFSQRRADAAIVIGARNKEPLVEDLIQRGCITSIFDQDLSMGNEENRLIINHDYAYTAYQSIKYLYSKGHRNIGIINGDMERHGGVAKQQGFQTGIKDFGLYTKPEWCLQTDFSENSAYRATKEFLKKEKDLPTAFAVANDSLAFGAMHAFRDHNITVPDDISLVASDGHPLAAYVNPPLTTFSYDMYELAENMVDITIKKVQHKETERSRLLKHTLIERMSCKMI